MIKAIKLRWPGEIRKIILREWYRCEDLVGNYPKFWLCFIYFIFFFSSRQWDSSPRCWKTFLKSLPTSWLEKLIVAFKNFESHDQLKLPIGFRKTMTIAKSLIAGGSACSFAERFHYVGNLAYGRRLSIGLPQALNWIVCSIYNIQFTILASHIDKFRSLRLTTIWHLY